MSRAWEGVEGLVGLIGGVNIGNGKHNSGGGRNHFYGQSNDVMTSLGNNGAACGMPPGLELGDSNAYFAPQMPQYSMAIGGAGLIPGAYHSGYQAHGGTHPAILHGMPG